MGVLISKTGRSCGLKQKLTLGILLVMLIGQFAIARPVAAQGSRIYFKDDGSSLVLGNNDYYEIAFRKDDGGILYILDKSTGQDIVNGSPYSCLWSVEFPTSSNPVIGGCDYTSGLGNNFIYKWDANTATLSFTYLPSVSSSRQLTASIVIQASENASLDMSIKISNYWNYPAELVRFPFPLALTESGINEALLPVTPGILLNAGFFNQHRTILRQHPGIFSDLLAVDSQAGKIALYTMPGGTTAPVRLGFAAYPEDTSILQFENPKWRHPTTARQGPDENTTLLVYDFPVLVANRGEWQSPTVRITVGKSFNDVIQAQRIDGRLDDLKPLADKLGSSFADLASSPLYVADPDQLGDLPFNQWVQMLPLLPKPATLLLVNYWQGSLYESHPDVTPPNPLLGSEEDLKNLIGAARQAGVHVMLMSMPAWWNASSPTLQALTPDGLQQVAVLDKTGEPVSSPMPPDTAAGQQAGFFVSPRAAFVQQRLSSLMTTLTDELGADLVYEEMLGTLTCQHDYNPAAVSLNDCTAWVDHTNIFKDQELFTTGGSDLFVPNEIGFIGSAHSDRSALDGELGQGNWTYYPLASLLAHDKVLFYPYWNDTSASKEAMAWSFSMGYMLNNVLVESPDSGQTGLAAFDTTWTTVLAEFQQKVGARIAGQPMTDYKFISNDVSQSMFGDVTVTRNWNAQKSYSTDQYSLPPDGFLVQSGDGSLTAGVFTAYNGQSLPGSEHYLIEVRSADSIKIFQPLGDPCELLIAPLEGWDQSGKAIIAEGYDSNGNQAGKMATDWSAGYFKFAYKPELNGKTVSYYLLSTGEASSAQPSGTTGTEVAAKPGQSTQAAEQPRKISENMVLVILVADAAMFLTFIISGVLLLVQRSRIRKAGRGE
jgi:hypothetical protein